MSQIFDTSIQQQQQQQQQVELISFWPILKSILNKYELQRFELLKLVNSDSGRCRAWIRSCLNENSIDKQATLFSSNKILLSQYYENYCLFLDDKYCQTLPIILTGLKSVLFAINIDNSNFNSPFKFIYQQSNTKRNKSPINESSTPTALVSSQVKDSSFVNKKKNTKQVKTQVVIFEDDYERGTIQINGHHDGDQPPIQRVLTNPIKIDSNKQDSLEIEKQSLQSTSSNNSLRGDESSFESQINNNLYTIGTLGSDNQSESSKISNDEIQTEENSTKNPEEIIITNELSLNELREALMLIMNRKDEVEKVNRQLKSELEEETFRNNGLSEKIGNMEKSHQNLLNSYKLKLQNFEQENQLLKDQLKKYVSAIQMSKREEDTSLEPLPNVRESLKNDYVYEAEQYEKKLIQVAEMHGELIEFNTHLSRELYHKNYQISKLTSELIQLRGPLPQDIQLNLNIPSIDMHSLESDSMSLMSTPLINIWIPSVFLRNDEKNMKKTYHVYQVYVRINDEEWNLFRRFTEFHLFHQFLKKKYPIVTTLQLPKKKTIGNKDSRFVQERKVGLQEYLRNVVNLLSQVDQDLSTKPCKLTLVKCLPFFNDSNLNEIFSLTGLVTHTQRHQTNNGSLVSRTQQLVEPIYDGL